MKSTEYDKVCYRTEQREEQVPLQHLKSGEVGYSFGCTIEGDTIQVLLNNGGLDSWRREECVEIGAESAKPHPRDAIH